MEIGQSFKNRTYLSSFEMVTRLIILYMYENIIKNFFLLYKIVEQFSGHSFSGSVFEGLKQNGRQNFENSLDFECILGSHDNHLKSKHSKTGLVLYSNWDKPYTI